MCKDTLRGNDETSFQPASVLSETGASCYLNTWIEQPADLFLCGVISHDSSVQLTLLNYIVLHVGWVEESCFVLTNILQFARFEVLAVLCLRIPFFWSMIMHYWVIYRQHSRRK